MKRSVTVCLGADAIECGTLAFEASGNRRAVSFAYADSWLAQPQRFALSPDLPLTAGWQFRARGEPGQSNFSGCFADVEPDGWGRTVIGREHARMRRQQPARGAAKAATSHGATAATGLGTNTNTGTGMLDEFDYLLWVGDVSRVGAIRFRDGDGRFLRSHEEQPETPPLINIAQLVSASRAIEENRETARDLAFLRGNGTSLGGMRPKCSIIDSDGSLAIGKFPSVSDTRSVVHGEVLALRLAAAAGINAAKARVVDSKGVPVAVITRFDRAGVAGNSKRLMYLSARSLMDATPSQQHSYVDIANTIRIHGSHAAADMKELWRRMVFNVLINNVDDHLNNHGFLHQAHDQWRLAPAFDLNPFPDKERSLKTWIAEDAGDAASLDEARVVAHLFGLNTRTSTQVLGEVRNAVKRWKDIARAIGMSARECARFAPAFAHPEL